MLNLVSILIGVVGLVLLVPSMIPLLGMGNWLVLPIAALGAGIGAISSKDGGRNFCLVVFILAVLRLMLGGGFI